MKKLIKVVVIAIVLVFVFRGVYSSAVDKLAGLADDMLPKVTIPTE